MPLGPTDKPTSELDVMGRVLHFGRQIVRFLPRDLEFVLVLRLKGGGQRAYFGGTGNEKQNRELLMAAARDERSKQQIILEG